MATNQFSKEQIVAFDEMILGFEDALVLSTNVNIYKTNAQTMERSNNTIWRPQPYIMQSYEGTDMTGNFQSANQLSVPVQINRNKSVPWVITPIELNDMQQQDRIYNSAKQRLASDLNVAIMRAASNLGSLVVARTTSATGFDDVAECESIMNEQGIPSWDRMLALSTRNYNQMAGNLANRQTLQGKPVTAYERAYVGQVASFETLKLDYANRLKGAEATGVTINGASQYWVPKATQTAPTGETSNVDNRYMPLSITVVSGKVKVGDCFTIEDVEAVQHITKDSTGQLKTFRVVGVLSGDGGTGVIQITPPIISVGAGTDAEKQYKNVTATPANGAAITFLNTTDAYVNPFWQKDSLELIPGTFVVDPNSGVQVLHGTTKQGITITMTKQFNNVTYVYDNRVDMFFGVSNLQPEMSGVLLFNQA